MRLKVERKKSDGGLLHFKLNGEMTVYSAPKLKKYFLGELDASSGISLDVAGIGEADSAGFQLLVFLRREAELAGKTFSVNGMSGRLKSIFSLYGENI